MHTLTTLTWNVFEGHKPAEVERTLHTLAETYQPDVFCLQECSFQGDIKVPGYTTFKLPLNNPPGHVRGEDADTAVLVRNGIGVRHHHFVPMKVSWKGPDHGIPHEPRVYQRMLLKVRGKTWKYSGGHWPFPPAKTETMRWVTRWLLLTLPGRPAAHVGDLNTTVAGLSRMLRRAKAHATGHRIDLAIYRNCHVKEVRTLGSFGSDHDAVLITLEAR